MKYRITCRRSAPAGNPVFAVAVAATAVLAIAAGCTPDSDGQDPPRPTCVPAAVPASPLPSPPSSPGPSPSVSALAWPPVCADRPAEEVDVADCDLEDRITRDRDCATRRPPVPATRRATPAPVDDERRRRPTSTAAPAGGTNQDAGNAGGGTDRRGGGKSGRTGGR